MSALGQLQETFTELGLYSPTGPVHFNRNGTIMTPDEVRAEMEKAPANPNPFDLSENSAEAGRMKAAYSGNVSGSLINGQEDEERRKDSLKAVRLRQIMAGSAVADLISDIDAEIARIDVELEEAGGELARIQAAMVANREEREVLSANLAEERRALLEQSRIHAELAAEQGLEIDELDIEERALAERLTEVDATIAGARSADEAIAAFNQREAVEARLAEIEARRLELAETLRDSEMTVALYEERIGELETSLAELDQRYADLQAEETLTEERIAELQQERAALEADRQVLVDLQNSGETLTIGAVEDRLSSDFVLEKTQDPSWLERHFGADSAIFQTAENIYNSAAGVVESGVDAVTEFASNSWDTISNAWTNFYASADPSGDGLDGAANVSLAYNNATDPAISSPEVGPAPQTPTAAQQFTA